MEAVGVAASLVGIVAFVGQSIDGLGKLKAFFDDVKKAKKKISALLSDIDELQDMLLRVQRLGEVFNQDAANSLPASSLPDFSALQMNVEACGEDILIWVKAAQELDLGSAIGLRAFFQRARVAAEKALFEEFGRKIASHRQRIGLSLSVLGRSLDFLSQAKLDGLRLQFNTLTESHLKLHDAVTKEADAVPPPPQEEPLSEILAKAFRHQEAAIEDVIGQSVTSDETDGHDISDLEEGINWTCRRLIPQRKAPS
ncbi:hypothetical protein GQ53DRAFT_866126 [Thozetella sp. PMI_491]|nr:hypothetical protein GQ53DRAFT_866126 [Thozetella sp. PMI_491]